jgi:hypothetical protein
MLFASRAKSCNLSRLACSAFFAFRNSILEQNEMKINDTRNVTMKILRERKTTIPKHKGDKENVNLILRDISRDSPRRRSQRAALKITFH